MKLVLIILAMVAIAFLLLFMIALMKAASMYSNQELVNEDGTIYDPPRIESCIYSKLCHDNHSCFRCQYCESNGITINYDEYFSKVEKYSNDHDPTWRSPHAE